MLLFSPCLLLVDWRGQRELWSQGSEFVPPPCVPALVEELTDLLAWSSNLTFMASSYLTCCAAASHNNPSALKLHVGQTGAHNPLDWSILVILSYFLNIHICNVLCTFHLKVTLKIMFHHKNHQRLNSILSAVHLQSLVFIVYCYNKKVLNNNTCFFNKTT